MEWLSKSAVLSRLHLTAEAALSFAMKTVAGPHELELIGTFR